MRRRVRAYTSEIAALEFSRLANPIYFVSIKITAAPSEMIYETIRTMNYVIIYIIVCVDTRKDCENVFKNNGGGRKLTIIAMVLRFGLEMSTLLQNGLHASTIGWLVLGWLEQRSWNRGDG